MLHKTVPGNPRRTQFDSLPFRGGPQVLRAVFFRTSENFAGNENAGPLLAT